MKKVLNFVLEKETPGTGKYQEVDSKNNPVDARSAQIGVLYVKKWAFTSNKPTNTLKVTLETD